MLFSFLKEDLLMYVYMSLYTARMYMWVNAQCLYGTDRGQ